MLDKFVDYIKKEQLLEKGDRVLIAVSGGCDSVLLAELFHKSKFKFCIAHCNFKLRPESDIDEDFVSKIAVKYNVEFFVKDFQTMQIAKERNLSIEMTARELRYEWFNQICREFNYNYIATAHHQNDSVETFLINLSRGTGISGLHGIAPKRNNIIRPLLFLQKSEIMDYCIKNNLQYREDSSNKENIYIRNIIRNNIIPEFEKINPAFLDNIDRTIKNIRSAEGINKYFIDKKKLKVVSQDGSKILLNIKALKKLKHSETYLYEFIKEFGFNSSVCDDISKSLDDIPGKLFYSDTHTLVRDRKYLIIFKSIDYQEVKNNVEKSFLINKEDDFIEEPLKLTIKKDIYNKEFSLKTEKNTAIFDVNQLKFPLEICKWKKGDYFYPYGLNKKKKLSRFFIDEKIPRPDKDNIYILKSDKKIIWVIGMRSDHRFRVTEKTKEILIIKSIIS